MNETFGKAKTFPREDLMARMSRPLVRGGEVAGPLVPEIPGVSVGDVIRLLDVFYADQQNINIPIVLSHSKWDCKCTTLCSSPNGAGKPSSARGVGNWVRFSTREPIPAIQRTPRQ